jgi:hypothetical protein
MQTRDLRVTGSAQFSGSLIFNAIGFTATEIATHAGSHIWGTDSGNYHYFTGSITASNNIHATNFYGDGSGLTSVTASYITSSDIVGAVINAVSASSVPFTGLSGSATIWHQDTDGNAATATQLSSSVNINGVAFNGSGNITVPASGSTLLDTVPISKGGTGQTNSSSWSNHMITTNASGTLNYNGTIAIAPNHDSLAGYVTEEHLDWSSDVSASATINANNIPTLNQSTTGTATNALTASYITSSNIDGYVDNATNATNAVTAETASYVPAAHVDGYVSNASYATNAGTVDGITADGFTLQAVSDYGHSTTTTLSLGIVSASGDISSSGTVYAQSLNIGGGASGTSTITATNITASGHVSSSNFYGDGSALTGVGLDSNSNVSIASLTASSHISASSIYGTNLYISGSAQMSGSLIFNAISFTETSIATHAGDHVWGTDDGSSHYFSGSISASSTISSSGAISASGFFKNGVEVGTSNADFASVDENILPDNTQTSQSLGSSAKKWENVYAKNTFFGAIHEINLETKDIGDLPEGTVLVHSDKGLVPCTIEGDYLVMGVSSPGTDYPIVLGAEPVLIDGRCNSGDFIVASTRLGYGKAISPYELSIRSYSGKIIAQALESSEGGLIKAMIRKM